MRKSQKGTSVSEYALIGGLVVIVGIGTLSVLGQNVSTMFSNTISKKTAQAAAPATTALSNPSVAALPAFQAGAGVSDINISVINKNGQTVDLSIPNYPFDKAALARDIEVNGSDATTTKLALTLSLIADKLLANDIIDKDDADLLKDISKEGFDMAKLQENMNNKLENAIKGKDLFNNPPMNATRIERNIEKLDAIYEKIKIQPFMQQANLSALINDSVFTIRKTGQETLKYNTMMIYDPNNPADRTVQFDQLYQFTGGKDLNQTLTGIFKQNKDSSSNLCNMSVTGKVSGLNCVNRVPMRMSVNQAATNQNAVSQEPSSPASVNRTSFGSE